MGGTLGLIAHRTGRHLTTPSHHVSIIHLFIPPLQCRCQTRKSHIVIPAVAVLPGCLLLLIPQGCGLEGEVIRPMT